MRRVDRWLYRGGRPNRVARVIGRWMASLYALGISPNYLVALEVRGRRSGQIITMPLVMAVVGNERYLVSMLGDKSNWVRNVQTAQGQVSLRHGRREHVRLIEVPPEQRAPVLRVYLQRTPNARVHVPVHQDAPLADFERVAGQFPVFRLVTDGVVAPSNPRSAASISEESSNERQEQQ